MISFQLGPFSLQKILLNCRPEYDREDPVQYHDCAPASAVDAAVPVCDVYSNHGHCPDSKECPNSHDIDNILFKKEGNRWSKMIEAVNGRV